MSRTADGESGPQGVTKKRRSMKKCEGCRQRKIACLPKDRVWTSNVRELCNNCDKLDLPCGPNLRHNAKTDVGPRKLLSKDTVEGQTSTGSPRRFIHSRPDLDLTPLAASNASRNDSLLRNTAPDCEGLQQAASWDHSGADQEMTIDLSTPGRIDRPPSLIYGGAGNSQLTYEPMAPPRPFRGGPFSVPETTIQHSAMTTTVPYASSVQSRSTRAEDFSNPPGEPVPGELRSPTVFDPPGNAYLPDTAFRRPKLTNLNPRLSSPDQPFNPTHQAIDILDDPSIACGLVPLSFERNFRLVELRAGQGNAPLEARLTACKLESQGIDYDALSYTWGEPSAKPASVQIATDNGVTCVAIGSNLANALRAMRYVEGSRMFWIDAICINSRDVSERNSQTSLMREIYRRAASVCAWLGPEAENSHLAFELIMQSTNLDAFAKLVQDPSLVPYRASLTHLMMRPWFRRAWTVQEVVLAKHTLLHCGSLLVGWSSFVNAVTLFGSMYHHFKSGLRSTTDRLLEVMHDFSLLDANRVVQISRLLVRKSDSGDILQYLQPLESLVAMCASFEALDSRDRIYALLSISRDESPESRRKRVAAKQPFDLIQPISNKENRSTEPTNGHEPRTGSLDMRGALELPNPAVESVKIDYGKSVYDVCREFLDFAVGRSKSLDILCRPWAPKGQNLPSWMPTVAGAAYVLGKDNYYRRVRADPLVEMFSSQRFAVYNAARDTCPVWHCEAATESIGRLYVRGFACGSISAKKLPATAGIIPHAWFNLVEWEDVTTRPASSLWQVLVADREDASHCAATLSYAWAYHHVSTQRQPGSDLDTSEFLASGEHVSVVREYLLRIQSVVWGRRLVLIRIGDQNFLGLAPELAKKKDVVCIVYGCSVPLLLRNIDGGRYQLVGECYVRGLMNGEALDLRDKFSFTEKMFTLV